MLSVMVSSYTGLFLIDPKLIAALWLFAISLPYFLKLQLILHVAGDGKSEYRWSSSSDATISTAECAEY